MKKPKNTLPVRPAEVKRDRTWATRRLGGALLFSQADTDLLNAIRPRCARCGKPVDSMTWGVTKTPERDKAAPLALDGPRPEGSVLVPHRPRLVAAVAFEVSCHGATETMIVSFDDLPALMYGGVQGAEAFHEPDLIEKENDDAA